MRKTLLAAAALTIAAALALAGVATATKPTVVRAGNLVFKIDGGVTPKKLPRRRLAPIALHASGSIGTADGSHPPALQKVKIEFDKHGTIDAKGLPVCHAGQLQARDTKHAKAACPSSIVGHGSTSVEVAFAEQQPFDASGPLVVFNGGVHGGVTTLYIHAYVAVPAPTAIVTVVKVRKIHRGRYGTEAIATVPTIAGGSGSVTRFNLVIQRNFRQRGHRVGYLMAKCANGRFYARALSFYSDGTRLAGNVVRTCKPR